MADRDLDDGVLKLLLARQVVYGVLLPVEHVLHVLPDAPLPLCVSGAQGLIGQADQYRHKGRALPESLGQQAMDASPVHLLEREAEVGHFLRTRSKPD